MRVASTAMSPSRDLTTSEHARTVITPSVLLAHVAEQQLVNEHLHAGTGSWVRPDIYSFDAWLEVCWREARYRAADIPALLSPSQELALWRNVVEAENRDLFDPAATARLNRRAARELADWGIDRDGAGWNDHEDAQQFRKWNTVFRQKCVAENWMTRGDVLRALPRWIRDNYCEIGEVLFLGFPRLFPALEQVRRALGDRARVARVSAAERGRTVRAHSCSDQQSAFEIAARMTREAFELNPSQSIGVFVPGLEGHLCAVERAFQNVFYSFGHYAAHSVFHLNAAPRLRDHPLISASLSILEFAKQRIPTTAASAIFRSPFIGGAAEERSARARADIELRKLRELDCDLMQTTAASRRATGFLRILGEVRSIVRTKPDRAELGQWSAFFGALVAATGWPGEGDLTADEQEAAELWKDSLSQLSALGMVVGRVPLDVAINQLRSLLGRPGIERGDWFSPVQILDCSDAAALRFDYAITADLSDEGWPLPVRISPLIPFRLQRERGVPGSSAESTKQEQERITKALFETAPDIDAIYSGRLAPMVKRWVTHEVFTRRLLDGVPRYQSFPPAPLEEVEDWKAPPFDASRPVPGGTRVIRAQSQCPFRAFAEFRLDARGLEDGCFGFDARERGKLVHKVLEIVWGRLETSERLKRIGDEELQEIIRDAIQHTVGYGQTGPFGEQVASAERERLQMLVSEWLHLERTRRQKPFTVETTEKSLDCECSGLRFKIRVDRIDRLKDGGLLLIDYKSGLTTVPQLEPPRPKEPQLLVYAQSVSEPVDGVFFAQIRARDVAFKGISRDRQIDRQNSCKDWDGFLANAREAVDKIAAEFVDGIARVDPLKDVCGFCDVKPFCRIGQRAATNGDDSES